VTAFSYEREHQHLPQLGKHVDLLETLLKENGRKSRRERLTMTRMFDLLKEAGYTGGYDAVRRHARQWKRTNVQAAAGEPVTAFIPLWFAPGEVYQFDWSHEIVVLGGVTTTVKVAHIVAAAKAKTSGHPVSADSDKHRTQGIRAFAGAEDIVDAARLQLAQGLGADHAAVGDDADPADAEA